LKKQVSIFFAALMFLTRLPIPKWVQHQDDYLQKSTKYFTTVGMIVGILVGATYIGTSYIFSNTIAIVLSMLVGILTTGAFHEDGLADVCDAFGGGWTKEKILTIMKDSRLGTYGTVGLFFVLLLKFLLLLEIANMALSPQFTLITLPYIFIFPIVMVVAHSMSRFMPLLIIEQYDYVYQEDLSKSKPMASQKLSFVEILFAFMIGIVGFLFLPLQLMGALLFMITGTYTLGRYFKKWIGGYTGDCLGTVQQVSELIFYFFVLIINKFLFY
jgi:adenosylcobinamide-GDP ribazoletransferase